MGLSLRQQVERLFAIADGDVSLNETVPLPEWERGTKVSRYLDGRQRTGAELPRGSASDLVGLYRLCQLSGDRNLDSVRQIIRDDARFSPLRDMLHRSHSAQCDTVHLVYRARPLACTVDCDAPELASRMVERLACSGRDTDEWYYQDGEPTYFQVVLRSSVSVGMGIVADILPTD